MLARTQSPMEPIKPGANAVLAPRSRETAKSWRETPAARRRGGWCRRQHGVDPGREEEALAPLVPAGETRGQSLPGGSHPGCQSSGDLSIFCHCDQIPETR